jgi:hypothetical protein
MQIANWGRDWAFRDEKTPGGLQGGRLDLKLCAIL